MKYYQLTTSEKILNKILNDSSVKVTELDAQDCVHELMRINRAIALLTTDSPSLFVEQCISYKKNILQFLDGVK